MTGKLTPNPALPEQPPSLPDDTLQCPACGTFNLPLARVCVQCSGELPPVGKLYDTPGTVPVRRKPQIIAVERHSQPRVALEATVLLQFLPSGICHTLDIRQPVILGRTMTDTSDRVLDLTDLSAMAHGVSRRHCALQQRGEHLIVTDLGSVNGTFLNNLKLSPFVEHVVAHGDRLILGTLHLAIFFDGSGAPAS